jgi:hypothetical protein
MSIKPSGRILRVEHTGLSQRSIYLTDIDNPENKLQGRKVKVYVPYRQTIEIPATERALLSYEQGNVAGFVEQGYLKAWLIDNPSVLDSRPSAGPPPSVVTVDQGQRLVLVDSSVGPVTVVLPLSADNSGGVMIKRVSSDTNPITVLPSGGDDLEGAPSYVLLESLDWVHFSPDQKTSWWRSGELSSGGGGAGSWREELVEVVNTADLIHTVTGVPISGTLVVSHNGLKLAAGAGRDYTVAGATVTLNPGYLLTLGDVLSYQYAY